MRGQALDAMAFADRLGRRLDRRVVIKAGASLAAMGLIGANRLLPAVAQEAPETLAGEWTAQANTGGFSASADAVTFKTEFPFSAFAPHWSGAVGYWPQIETRFSPDGSSWSDPVQISASDHDAGRPDRDGRIFGRLVFPGQNQFVQYRTLDANGAPAEVEDLTFTYIDASPGPTVDDVYAAATEPSVAQPPIISRAAWGANEAYRFNRRGLIWEPEYRTVEHVIIHHTETPNFQDPLVAIRSVYYYHAVTRGWGDIGYNYLVDFMGNVYEGRNGGENVVGGHAYEYAYGSSGIGTMGRFFDEDATPEMQAGVVWITAWVGRNLDPYGRSDFHEENDLPTICGHRDVNESICPGDMLYSDLPAIRDYVSAVLYEGQSPGAGGGDFAIGDQVEVIVSDTNLRQWPGLDGMLVATMALGTPLTVQDGPTTVDGYSWFEVSGDIGSGWCASFLLQRTGGGGAWSLEPGDVVIVDTDALNLRSDPAVWGSIVAVLPNGATGVVTGGATSQDGYTWYRLNTDEGSGWAAGEFLRVVVDGPPPPNDGFAIGDTVFVATDALNLRASAGTGARVLAVLPTGAELTITATATRANGYAWYGVSSDRHGDGWCVADYLSYAGSSQEIGIGDEVRVIDGELNLRADPSTSSDVLIVLPDGAPLTVIDGPETANSHSWWQVTSDDYGEGWVAGEFLELQ